MFSPAGCMFAQQLDSGSVLHGKLSRLAAEFRKSADRSAARFYENHNVPNLILGSSSSQSFAEPDEHSARAHSLRAPLLVQ